MRGDHLVIGSAPSEEDCAQVGTPNYIERASRECAAYIKALVATVGAPPEGARLAIRASAHDFGTYYEVVCCFEPDNNAAVQYAYKCEASGPATWAEAGMTAPV